PRLPPPPRSTLFPYTTLFRSVGLAHRLSKAFGGASIHVGDHLRVLGRELIQLIHATTNRIELPVDVFFAGKGVYLSPEALVTLIDRKSTRLNSSHLVISYAVF